MNAAVKKSRPGVFTKQSAQLAGKTFGTDTIGRQKEQRARSHGRRPVKCETGQAGHEIDVGTTGKTADGPAHRACLFDRHGPFER
jgi:hypothetical protein